MDTSDGLLTALDQLMRLNSVGFVVDASPEDYLDPLTLQMSRQAKVSPWIPLAGPHGEFELVFTVPPAQVDRLLERASVDGWTPVMLGKVVAEPGVSLSLEGDGTHLDTGRIRNLFDRCNGNIDEYFSGLLSLQTELNEGGSTNAG
jgi:thiamine-monophosphate kinase